MNEDNYSQCLLKCLIYQVQDKEAEVMAWLMYSTMMKLETKKSRSRTGKRSKKKGLKIKKLGTFLELQG